MRTFGPTTESLEVVKLCLGILDSAIKVLDGKRTIYAGALQEERFTGRKGWTEETAAQQQAAGEFAEFSRADYLVAVADTKTAWAETKTAWRTMLHNQAL